MGKRAKRKQRATMNKMNQMAQNQLTDFQERQKAQQAANVLGTPELKGNAQITLRIGSNSQYKTVNKVRSKTGNKILSWRAIPTIPTKTLETLKPHDKTLDNAKGIKNIINSKIVYN